jgi:hypothetical protein
LTAATSRKRISAYGTTGTTEKTTLFLTTIAFQATETDEDLAAAVARIRKWGETREWRGYDPYDALNSPAAPALTLGTALGRRVVTQAVKRSPVNLRPVLGIRPAWNAKALGIVASAYARLAAAGDASARPASLRILETLEAQGPGWGYHFDVQTRFFRYAAGTPNTIATTFVAQAFLDAHELIGDERSGETALRAARFLVEKMLVHGGRGAHFRYLEREDELVHNANLLACAVLARTARCLDAPDLVDCAAEALSTSLGAQRPDGAWPYSAGDAHGWVDNFHTGYVLESLSECALLVPGAGEQLDRGFDYWERTLFLEDGTPKYFDNRTLPLDAHNYAQAIETWLAVADRRRGALEHARRTAEMLIRDFLADDGHVRFQHGRWWSIGTPFVRWTTAPSFRALARLILARSADAAVVAARTR